jgi:hypothetical protein
MWWSHKLNGPAVKYEIGVAIKTVDIKKMKKVKKATLPTNKSLQDPINNE